MLLCHFDNVIVPFHHTLVNTHIRRNAFPLPSKSQTMGRTNKDNTKRQKKLVEQYNKLKFRLEDAKVEAEAAANLQGKGPLPDDHKLTKNVKNLEKRFHLAAAAMRRSGIQQE